MSRLIIVSNRVQQPVAEGAGNQGGLAVALSAALREHSGLWFGWSGDTTAHFTGEIDFQTNYGVTTATIDLEEQDIDEYYNGYANRTLWPLFHYRIDLAEFQRSFAGGYERVNARFADTLIPLIEPDDLLWIHDYHLIPLGRELRRRGCTNRIGFFLHTPWPAAGILRTLPSCRQLVESMFHYDVVGFQTPEWLSSFRYYVASQTEASVGADGWMTLENRTMRAIACPIGLDTASFVEASTAPVALEACERMRVSANGRAMIVGADRLDYSKGLPERFLGYEHFLATHPERHGKVFLLQIAPVSRDEVATYQDIHNTLDSLAGRINGSFANIEWVPLRYVNQGHSREQLAGIYRAARVGLVTSLRDGMNLVAKEYVAAQDPEDPGVLILSRFAGAALQLRDAVLINPYSAEEIADAIERALSMPLAERKARWRKLMDSVEREDVIWWRKRFVEALSLPNEAPKGNAVLVAANGN